MSAPVHKSGGVECSRCVCEDAPVAVEVSRFGGVSGVEEIHLMARPTQDGAVDEQLDWLRRGVESLGYDGKSAVLRRFFCADLPRNIQTLQAVPFSNPGDSDEPCAVSWVGQAPAGPANVALWAYHVRDPGGELNKRLNGSTLTVERGALRHHWTPGITSANGSIASAQTRDIFDAYDRVLHEHGMSLDEHVLRTWLFLRDIDADYAEMTQARREHFARHGLTPRTHYIASTGIGDSSANPAARVAMDAYAIGELRAEQVSYIKALDHLSPTDAYGVTFERATAIAYQDRKHLFISGTASIDERGNLLHAGDVSRQLDRTLDNIDALLSESGATREHMCTLIAYVRNSCDEPVIRRGIRGRYGDTPLIVVTASVCRPDWLVEIEGQAIIPAHKPELPPF